jgi:ABC-type glycerol-3-phosphate transport system substrate-binding protein
MWAYGGKAVDADGKTVAVSSPETAEAIEYVKRLYNEAMEPEVLSWDDSSNNRFLISGKGAWIANPPSPYLTAKTRNMPIAEEIYFQLMPAGPKGRHTTTFIRSIGIWKFSKNIEPAKEFTKFFFAEENYNDYINAALHSMRRCSSRWKIIRYGRSTPSMNLLKRAAVTATSTAGRHPAMSAASR